MITNRSALLLHACLFLLQFPVEICPHIDEYFRAVLMEHVVTFEWTLVLILQGHPHGDSHIVMRVGAWKEV